jgi:hypothetical protein
MNTLEDRLRGSLEAHAQTFSASPDAWQRINARGSARTRRGAGRLGGGHSGGHSGRRWAGRTQLLLPVAAAVAVVAVIAGATTLGHGFAGSVPAGSGERGRTAPSQAERRPGLGHGRQTGPAGELLVLDPPISAIIRLGVTGGVTAWAWVGRPNPQYWFPYIATSPQLCHWIAASNGSGSGDCWPMPSLSAAHPADVTDNNEAVGIGRPVISGVAELDVTSVTAVFPDGQRFAAAIGTGQGFPVKAWSVACPRVNGTKLIFAGAAGQVLATLSTAAPIGPVVLDVPQPTHGAVALFRYPVNGTVHAYLIDGHVAFFGWFGGAFSPAAVSGSPPMAGMAESFGYLNANQFALVKAFGYAQADVVKVVVRLPDGGRVTTAPVAAGWPGSDVRLWQVSLPLSSWKPGAAQPVFIATGYDAAGQVVGRWQLGQPPL